MRHFSTVPIPFRFLFPSGVIWSITRVTDIRSNGIANEKRIYLTFDDGPVPEVTPLVLDILREYNAKATFFCIGDNVVKHPEVFNAITRDGHSVGNHTYNHLNGYKTPDADYFANIKKCSNLTASTLFRPPYGRIKRSQARQLVKTYDIIMWSVLTGDYNQNLSKEKVLDNAISNSRSGSIVVFHDSIKASNNMLYALPKFLEYYSNKGYIFESLKSSREKA